MPTLQSTDIDQALEYFDKSRQRVVEATAGLSDAQWRFKPAPDRWSIAEILEHMVIVHERVLGRVREQLSQAPAPPEGRAYQLVDRIVMEKIPDRSIRAKAPDAIQPTGQWSQPDAMDRLFQNYECLAEVVRSSGDLREHWLDSPPLKIVTNGEFDKMDGYQWALTAAAHDQRHVNQILELKADVNYPRA